MSVFQPEGLREQTRTVTIQGHLNDWSGADETVPVDARVLGSMLWIATLQLCGAICVLQTAQADQLAPEPLHLRIRQDPAPLCLLLRPAHASLAMTRVTTLRNIIQRCCVMSSPMMLPR